VLCAWQSLLIILTKSGNLRRHAAVRKDLGHGD
jgi:hypothetical protein